MVPNNRPPNLDFTFEPDPFPPHKSTFRAKATQAEVEKVRVRTPAGMETVDEDVFDQPTRIMDISEFAQVLHSCHPNTYRTVTMRAVKAPERK